MSTDIGPQRIVKLEIENYKRIAAAVIEPGEDDSLVILLGENGSGKTTVIDAIENSVAGAHTHPEKPIREGERMARVITTLTDLIVTRRWVAGAEKTTTELEVRARDGLKFSSPQKVLDRLFDELSFNALEFESMKPKEQLEMLKKLVGVDTTLLDAQRKQLYDARTLVGRELDAAQARLRAMSAEKPPPVVDTAALLKERGELTNAQQWERQAKTERDAAMRRIDDCKEAVRVAEQALAQAKVRLETAMKQAAEADNAADDAEDKATGAAQRLAAVDEQLQKASAIATANARWAEREKLEAEVKRLDAEHAAKNSAIGTIDAQKLQLVSSAKFPIEGLSFGEDGVLYKGANTKEPMPFEQASQAERLRVSVAVGAARNPKLRVMTVREGSRLDKKGLVLLAKLAKERDLQVWLERPGEDGPATVIIVDGTVTAAKWTPTEAA